jgi:hypothetical protein
LNITKGFCRRRWRHLFVAAAAAAIMFFYARQQQQREIGEIDRSNKLVKRSNKTLPHGFNSKGAGDALSLETKIAHNSSEMWTFWTAFWTVFEKNWKIKRLNRKGRHLQFTIRIGFESVPPPHLHQMG